MLKRLGSNEPGYSRFDVIQDAGDANRVWVYEVYQDEVAYQAHLRAPHLKKLWGHGKGLAWRGVARETEQLQHPANGRR